MMKREMKCFRVFLLAVVACGAMCGVVRGQCEPSWQPFVSGGQTGVSNDGSNGYVLTLMGWNGNLMVGGYFATAGGQKVNNIARWDGLAWHPFATGENKGVDAPVWALTVWNGDLVVGGTFTIAGDQIVNNIARWDGSTWHQFTGNGQIGVSGKVSALLVRNGELVVGGAFTTAGSQTVNGIARWDGSAWHAFESGGQVGVGEASIAEVQAITVWNGDLIAGGRFGTAGGQDVSDIARWDGETWHPFLDGKASGVGGLVNAVLDWNGDLIVGGSFVFAGQQEARRIARWDGSWHVLPCPVGGPGLFGQDVKSLAIWNNDLIAAGEFVAACGQPVNRIARWDGSAWHPFISGEANGLPPSNFMALAVWKDELIVGGDFTTAGGQTVNSIARWGCAIPIPGDINGDSIVNVIDLLAAINTWGACANPNSCPADVAPPGPPQGDDQVNVQDLLFIINNWG